LRNFFHEELSAAAASKKIFASSSFLHDFFLLLAPLSKQVITLAKRIRSSAGAEKQHNFQCLMSLEEFCVYGFSDSFQRFSKHGKRRAFKWKCAFVHASSFKKQFDNQIHKHLLIVAHTKLFAYHSRVAVRS